MKDKIYILGKKVGKMIQEWIMDTQRKIRETSELHLYILITDYFLYEWLQ